MSGPAAGAEVLPAREAYRLWAPVYDRETAVSALEERVVGELGPSPAGLALLDVGCGTARRLTGPRARFAVGVDLVPAMLAEGRRRGRRAGALVAGDVRRLPIRAGAFDLVWCRLVLGHLADLDAAYGELGRVARAGSALVVTDFHPAAAAAGHRRTFRDGGGRLREVEHHVHEASDHLRAARGAGWKERVRVDACPGEPERAVYEAAGRPDLLEAGRAQPLVLAMAFTR